MADLKNYMVGDDEKTVEQIEAIVNSPAFAGSKVRIMPDAHAGKGCVVGTTATYSDRIVPNVVGVDIACRVSLFEIPHDVDLSLLDKVIHEVVPSGFSVHSTVQEDFEYSRLRCWHAMENKERIKRSLGTLGGGNHFIAVDVNEFSGQKYLAVHCGSRNLGKQVCEFYQKKALDAREDRVYEVYKSFENYFSFCKENGFTKDIQKYIECRNEIIKSLKIPDDLCYIEGPDMDDYLNDMVVCAEWSWINHKVIYMNIAREMGWE